MQQQMNDDVLLVLNPKARFERLVAMSSINYTLDGTMPMMRLIDALCMMKRMHETYRGERNLEYAYMYGMRIISLSKSIISRGDDTTCTSIATVIEQQFLSKEFFTQMEQIRDAINQTYLKEAELLSVNLKEKRDKLIASVCK